MIVVTLAVVLAGSVLFSSFQFVTANLARKRFAAAADGLPEGAPLHEYSLISPSDVELSLDVPSHRNYPSPQEFEEIEEPSIRDLYVQGLTQRAFSFDIAARAVLLVATVLASLLVERMVSELLPAAAHGLSNGVDEVTEIATDFSFFALQTSALAATSVVAYAGMQLRSTRARRLADAYRAVLREAQSESDLR